MPKTLHEHLKKARAGITAEGRHHQGLRARLAWKLYSGELARRGPDEMARLAKEVKPAKAPVK